MYFITRKVKDQETLDAVESLQDFIDEATEDVEADEEGTKSISSGRVRVSREVDGEIHVLRQGEMEDQLLHVNGNRVVGEKEHMYGNYSRVSKRHLGGFVTKMEAELRNRF